MPRYRQANASASKRKPARTKRGNGRLVVDARTRRGRRLAELIEAYSIGADLGSEEVMALVKSTAALQVEIETNFEDKVDRRQPIDHDVYTKLLNTRERSLEKLKEMRTRARPSIEQPTAGSAAVAALQRHLHFLVWARPHKASYAKGANDPELQAEYDRCEAAGEFLHQVR
jgi:hypothetical protein